MCILKRAELENIAIYIDDNNPKYELNYLYVDKENVAATNTRALCLVEHKSKDINEPFFVHKSLVKKALTERKAVYFKLSHNKVEAQDINEFEIISFSINGSLKDFKFPDYKRIIPEKLESVTSFVDNSQIAGICAVKKVCLNPKWIPKVKQGHIGINAQNLPVVIEDADYPITTIIMPIVDSFKEFDDNYL